MSSILRALKKLDEESSTAQQEGGAPKINIRHVVPQSARPPRFNYRVISIVLTVLLLAAFGWIFMIRDNTPNPAPKPGTQHETQKKQESPENTAAPVPTPAAKTAGDTSSNTPSPQTGTKVNREETTRNIPTPVGHTQPPAAVPVVPQPVPRRPSGAMPKPNPTGPVPTVTPNRPQFKFQGVLWSEKPERRVALINDKYLKEGDTINGVIILKIEKNSVTLQSGKDKWKLRVKK